MIREGFTTSDRTNGDDSSYFAGFHIAQYCMDSVEDTHDIDVEHTAPFGWILSVGLTQQHDAGVINQSAYGIRLIDCFSYCSLNGFIVSDIYADT